VTRRTGPSFFSGGRVLSAPGKSTVRSDERPIEFQLGPLLSNPGDPALSRREADFLHHRVINGGEVIQVFLKVCSSSLIVVVAGDVHEHPVDARVVV
jgi:hypothetical protein